MCIVGPFSSKLKTTKMGGQDVYCLPLAKEIIKWKLLLDLHVATKLTKYCL